MIKTHFNIFPISDLRFADHSCNLFKITALLHFSKAIKFYMLRLDAINNVIVTFRSYMYMYCFDYLLLKKIIEKNEFNNPKNEFNKYIVLLKHLQLLTLKNFRFIFPLAISN